VKYGREYLDRQQIDTFNCQVQDMAASHFGVDCDGDLPVDIRIIDRTRYERSHYLHVPYKDSADTSEEHEAVLDALMTNLSISTEDINRWHRIRRFDMRPDIVTATDENLTAENRKLVEVNAKLEADMREMRQDVGAKIRRDQAVKDAREKRDLMSDALHHLWHCEIHNCKECVGHKKKHRLEGMRPERIVRKEIEPRS
jgi:regulator of replication initiation timing